MEIEPCDPPELPKINGKEYSVKFEHEMYGDFTFKLWASDHFTAKDFRKLIDILEKEKFI